MMLRQWYQSIWPGLGLFGESYLLFSIGILKPLWEVLYPDCFLTFDTCSPRLVRSLTYAAVLGIILGMIVIGYLANIIGRRPGSIATASLMAIGSTGLFLLVLLVPSTESSNEHVLFLGHTIFLFIFGIGVGGEYPMAASTASERSMESSVKDGIYLEMKDNETSSLRGQSVQLVFTMQGLGIFINSLVMTIMLYLMGQTSNQYNEQALVTIWRVSYSIATCILLYVLISRVKYLEESKVWQEDKSFREYEAQRVEIDSPSSPIPQIQGNPSMRSVNTGVSSLSAPSVVLDDQDMLETPSSETLENHRLNPHKLLFRLYGTRLFGVSFSWLLWDISFYGNKLFQSSFLISLTGEETTLLEFAVASTLNSFFALLGYFGAALLLDQFGRKSLQQMGFLISGLLFVSCGVFGDNLRSGVLLVLYLGTSFFGQVGPNATTFLLPTEVFPTEMRTWCHGIAAASGKVGALIAAIVFNHINDEEMFLLSGYSSFAACVITFWAIPETSGLDLKELDLKWRLTRAGRRRDYEGAANEPQFMSYFERNKLAFKQRVGNFSALDIET